MNRKWMYLSALALLGVTDPARAQAPAPAAGGGTQPPAREQPLGLDPGAPQVPTLPGGVTPAFGTPTAVSEDFRLAIHGFVSVPLRLGINERENPGSDQQQLVLHAPPQVPGEFESFGYTGVVPDPWVQLNFTYGNPYVAATVILASRTVTNAVSYFEAQDMIGINDAFLTFRAPVNDQLSFAANVGAFANRYGQMGEYDLGRYGTPLIARISGVGFTGTGRLRLGSVELAAELGLHGQLTKTPVNVEPAGWNGFADPNVGSTFAAHGHVAAGLNDFVHVGVHAIQAFVRDDRVGPEQPRGDLSIFGADVRMTGGRFGHLYAGVAHTSADTARGISGVVRVLDAPGGLGLMRNYLGPNSEGTGELLTFGAEYTLSLGTLLRYPAGFEGNGPDLLASVFGITTGVTSPNEPQWDDVQKLKYGTELTYSMLSWFAAGGRYDRVIPDTDDATRTHAIATLRTIFRTNWNARDQVVLQYSHFFTGSGSVVVDGYPPAPDPTIEPDAHVVSLAASMWW